MHRFTHGIPKLMVSGAPVDPFESCNMSNFA